MEADGSSKSLLGKKKINMKVENSLWSDAFTIDTIGDTGKISCKLDTRRGSMKRTFAKSDKKTDIRSLNRKFEHFCPRMRPEKYGKTAAV